MNHWCAQVGVFQLPFEGQHHRVFWFILLSSLGLSVGHSHQYHRHECFVAVLGCSLALSFQSGTSGQDRGRSGRTCNVRLTFWRRVELTERSHLVSPVPCASVSESSMVRCGQVGMFGNSHDDDGRIKNLRPFEHVGDLDQFPGGIAEVSM